MSYVGKAAASQVFNCTPRNNNLHLRVETAKYILDAALNGSNTAVIAIRMPEANEI